MRKLTSPGISALISGLCLFLVLYALYDAQRELRKSHDVYTVTAQEIEWLSSALLLDHQRLHRSIEYYLRGDTAITSDDLALRLDIYWSRYRALSGYYQSFIDSIKRFQINDTKVASSLNEMATSFDALKRESQPVLELIEQQLPDLRSSNTEDSALAALESLDDHVTTFMLVSFELGRYFTSRQSTLMRTQLRHLGYAYLLAILGFSIVVFILLQYSVHKRNSASQLLSINGQLEAKIDETCRMSEELAYHASHDNLTGLANRRSVEIEIEQLIAQENTQFGVCFLDLDMFKVVNDTAGHAKGDQLLCEVSGVLNRIAPPGSTVARYGGDEFLLLIPQIQADLFRSLAQRICHNVAAIEISSNDEQFGISCSIGAVLANSDEFTMASLMAAADAVCYTAKSAGGAQVQFAETTQPMLKSKRSEQDCVRKIKQSLKHHRFRLYYQPIVDIQPTGGTQTVAWEILIRLQETDGTIIAAGNFLPTAESYRLASQIDRYVIAQVFAWLHSNPQELPKSVTLNVNLSGHSVGDAGILKFIEAKLQQYRIDANRICFEITETVAVGKNSKPFLCRLKSLGFQLALDDFGSGFSSFGYLESLPVDIIKIDGQFVRDLDTNPTHQAFVNAIHTVAVSMKKKTVVEFVESASGVEILQTMGVRYAQGYHFAKPKPLPVSKRHPNLKSKSMPESAHA